MPVLQVGRTQFKMCCLHGHDSLTWQGIECRLIRSHLNILLVRNMQHQSNGLGPLRGSEAQRPVAINADCACMHVAAHTIGNVTSWRLQGAASAA